MILSFHNKTSCRTYRAAWVYKFRTFKAQLHKKKNSIKTRFKLSTIKKEPLNLYLSETYSAQINLLAFFGFPLLQTFYELSEFKY